MGNYALNVLLHQLDKLDYAYDKFVKNGNVDSENKVAKENREKAKDLDDAIKILNTNADTGDRQLTIPDVSHLLAFLVWYRKHEEYHAWSVDVAVEQYIKANCG